MLKCFRGHFFSRFISPTVLCMCQCLVHSSNDGGFLASVCTQQFETCKINFEFKQSWSEAYVGCKQNVCSKSCPFAFVLLFLFCVDALWPGTRWWCNGRVFLTRPKFCFAAESVGPPKVAIFNEKLACPWGWWSNLALATLKVCATRAPFPFH